MKEANYDIDGSHLLFEIALSVIVRYFLTDF